MKLKAPAALQRFEMMNSQSMQLYQARGPGDKGRIHSTPWYAHVCMPTVQRSAHNAIMLSVSVYNIMYMHV